MDDARKIPYLLLWKDKLDGQTMEAVRLSHFIACGKENTLRVELKRPDGRKTFIQILWRWLASPRLPARRKLELAGNVVVL